MAIEQLGESLLASARKKSKKQERRAKIFTGLTLGLQVGNHFLRKKAQKRANEFWTSNQGLIDRRAGQFTQGVDFWDKHNTMINTYGESKDSVTGENWVDALKQQKLKQYQADPRYSKLYSSALAEDQLEFNRSVDKLIQDDISAYRQKVSGYSDFRTIGKDTKETRTAYLKPLKDKLQKGVDIINKQDNVGGWLLGGMGLKSSNDQLENVSVRLPEGYTEQDKAELKELVNNTFTNMNKVNNAYGVKEAIPDVQLESMIKKQIFKPKVDLTNDLKVIASSVLEDTETFKKLDFKIKIGKTETNVANFLEQFEDDNGKHLTDSQKQNIINDALIIADYQYKIFKNNQEKSGAGPLMIPEGGIKSFFDEALKKVIGEDLTFTPVTGGINTLFKTEAEGTYKRTARENFVNSIFNTPKDNIEVPAPNKKDGTITVDIDEAQGSIDVPEDTSKNPLDTPETPTFDRNRVVAVLNAPEWNDGSRTNKEKAAFWNGLITQFPESADEIGQLAEESAGGKQKDMTRIDGTTKSAVGYKGPIKNNVTGQTMTEVSISFDDFKNPYSDKDIIPLIVPTLTDKEISILQDMEIEGNAKNIPQEIKDKAIAHARLRIEAGLNPFYEDGEDNTPAPSPTPVPKDSLLSPNIPTQEELVKEFEILGASKMSSEEIDIRLNEMINQKEDFTTDEYIKLITYLNSKQGINPTSLNTSLLEPTKELTDSEIIANSLKGTGRNPLEVLRDSKINNLEKAVTRMKAGKPNIGTSSSAVVRWLKDTKDTDYYKLSTKERIASTEEYIETLKS